MTGELTEALVSHDEQWVAFRRGRAIWKAPLDEVPVKESDASQVSELGGEGFSLFSGAPTVLFSIGHRAWQQSLTDSSSTEMPIRASLSRPVPPTLLIRNIHILDYDAEDFGPAVSVLVENGRIRQIAPDINYAAPDDSVVIDGAGRFAVPGLFDSHVHSNLSANTAYVAYGVTSLRDLGRGLPWVASSADRADTSNQPMPRYFFVGYSLGNPNGTSAEEAVASVKELSLSGVSLVKNYATTPWPLQRAKANQARRLGLPVAAHGMSIKEIVKGVGLGYATLEHSGFRLYEDILGMMASSGTRWNPTMGATFCYCLPFQTNPEIASDKKILAHFPGAGQSISEQGPERKWALSMLPEIFVQQQESVRAAHSKGIPLLVGTDSPDNHHLSFPGLSAHWELEFFVKSGIPPAQALRIATLNAAQAVGADRDLGSIEIGKFADLLLLDANPLEDIRNTQNIWRVLKGGWVFDPEDLRPESN